MVKRFVPFEPDGSNPSENSAISDDGIPEFDKIYHIPARCGVAVKVKKGQILCIYNTHGSQVCDFFAFCEDNLNEYMSMEHVHTSLETIFPKKGDHLVTNYRRSIMSIADDTSPGVHDTVIASCGHQRYQQLGCKEYHDNCIDNLRMSMIAINLKLLVLPAPFNLWMNIPVSKNGSIKWDSPVSKPGDKILFKAEIDLIAAMSSCPQDITPINGENCKPTELHFEVLSN